MFGRRAAGTSRNTPDSVTASSTPSINSLDDILDFPDAFPVVYRGSRRYLVPRFPYCIYYRLDAGDAIVVAVLHVAMNPRKTRRRLRA